MREVKAGSLESFFASAKETARQIDQGVKVTPKFTIWMEVDDFLYLLHPERRAVLNFLKSHQKVSELALAEALGISNKSLTEDLSILSKYQLVTFYQENVQGLGEQKIIKPNFQNEAIELRAAV